MSLFRRNPVKKLKKAYQQKLKAAMHAMHNGDIRKNAELFVEAETIREEIEQLESIES